jgi:hypothetical protein
MRLLEKQVDELNEAIVSSLVFVPSGKVKAYGLAETMLNPVVLEDGSVKVQRFPVTIDNDGEVDRVEVDDIYAVIMYHKLESTSNSIAPKTNYGRTTDLFEQQNISLVVIAFRDQVQQPGYVLESIIKNYFLDKLEDGAAVRIGNSNFDKLSLLQREFSEVELNYAHLIIFELKYRIESTQRRRCFNICGTGCEAVQ